MIATDPGRIPMDEDDTLQHTTPLPRELPFPPLTKQHILNCAYDSWWPKYRSFTPKSRIVSLTKPFVDYLQADGIFLPDDEPPIYGDDEEDEGDIAAEWRPLHKTIKATIRELGGKVVPKLNWSAPKDATHMLGNTMACNTPDEIYLLLKSSDFINFDLNHAFDSTVDDGTSSEIPFHLVLRKSFNINPSAEFRCFVRDRRIIGVTQRDMNYFEFLFQLQDSLLRLIESFFEKNLKDTFPDDNFVFDVYIPDPHNKVWLIDINPWAQRTDPILFSWLELLTMVVPEATTPQPVRLHFAVGGVVDENDEITDDDGGESEEESDIEEDMFVPEFRLLKQDDPEAYSFASPQYSAHKMPKDVVDAASVGNVDALRELSLQWKEALSQAQKQDRDYESAEE